MSRPRWCRLITPLTAALIAVALAGPAQAGPAFTEAGAAVEAALRARLAPDGAFVVWGGTAPGRGNPTLRADLDRIAAAATALGAAAPRLGATDAERAAVGRRLARLVEDYRGFVAARWPIGATTAARFDAAAAAIARALPTAPPAPANPYLAKVDAELTDPTWRAAIRAVQPAVVKLGGGSGVNLAATGLIVTAAHVVDEVGRRLTVRFPDGRELRRRHHPPRRRRSIWRWWSSSTTPTDLPTARLAAARAAHRRRRGRHRPARHAITPTAPPPATPAGTSRSAPCAATGPGAATASSTWAGPSTTPGPTGATPAARCSTAPARSWRCTIAGTPAPRCATP
jgi:hypothetical protein